MSNKRCLVIYTVEGLVRSSWDYSEEHVAERLGVAWLRNRPDDIVMIVEPEPLAEVEEAQALRPERILAQRREHRETIERIEKAREEREAERQARIDEIRGNRPEPRDPRATP